MKYQLRFNVTLAIAMTAAAANAVAADIDELNLGRMTTGYTYYNRPFANSALHDADVATCLIDAANMRSFQEELRGNMGGVLGVLLEGARADSANRGVVAASLENCMVVRGWRVVHLGDDEGKQLSMLPAGELAATLAPWIGAKFPHGTVVREWRNDAAMGAVNHFSLHAQHTKNGQLSLLAVQTNVSEALRNNQSTNANPSQYKMNIKLDPKWRKTPLKPEMLDSVSSDATILLVNVAGFSVRQGNGFIFSRVGPDTITPPSTVDHGTDDIKAFGSTLAGGSEGKIMAFAVPPGQWRIQAMSNGGLTLNFCLGAPMFQAKAGEVVYAGRLDMKQDVLVPDMSLDRVKAWMAGAKAADRIKPVLWRNGSRGKCSPNSIYALEFPGSPFEEDYVLGSKALPLHDM
jgi:hypothetical protein